MIKKFNEMRIGGNIQAHTREDGMIRTMKFITVDDSVAGTFRKNIKNGFKPFYFDIEEYKLIEIPVNTKFKPLKIVKRDANGKLKDKPTTSTFTYYDRNPYGDVYFLSEEELPKLKEISDHIKSALDVIDQQRNNVLQLMGSYIVHNLDEK